MHGWEPLFEQLWIKMRCLKHTFSKVEHHVMCWSIISAKSKVMWFYEPELQQIRKERQHSICPRWGGAGWEPAPAPPRIATARKPSRWGPRTPRPVTNSIANKLNQLVTGLELDELEEATVLRGKKQCIKVCNQRQTSKLTPLSARPFKRPERKERGASVALRPSPPRPGVLGNRLQDH